MINCQLVSGNMILDYRYYPQDLDFSKLHGISQWAVLVIQESGEVHTVASACFNDSEAWAMRINGRCVKHLTSRNHIVPLIQHVLELWTWENRLDENAITIYPESGG